MSQDLSDTMDASIDALATLYMWEEHKGVSPHEARSTRSWFVRDWMKEHRFQNDAFPGMHLRDQVVERLRDYGMPLTPRPLTHTAHEYYSMQYDRYADPRSPFGRRKLDEDGNVIRKERRLKLPSRKAANGNGEDHAGDEHGGGAADDEGRGRFSIGGLIDKMRGRDDAPPPQGE